MSSRAQDSQRLATLATQLNDLAAGLVKIVGVVQEIHEEVALLQHRFSSLDSSLDDVDRRVLNLERIERG
jgi:hypothetical protein